MGAIAITAVVIPALALAAILKGYALYVLWGWFVTPLGVPGIGVAHAIGIALAVSFLTASDTSMLAKDQSKSDVERLLNSIGTTFVTPIFAILIGWIVKGFMQ